ncbi:uncharacterized protein LOC119401575 isoform X2 [Rhipicephalus sanguineus]|uniref:uncharacterized protein LOC119401575 isoform X2 n=1 Tax=Rhipicephalus sanguineus TaxID=34632 RepID=UPI0020C4CBEA|nr:uncharacterized protein LOC119401575 isoform X2 [Rhipicephalus sanguineus]
MGTLVQFRDLPGGPVKIKFADDITRHCLCKSCNMLSLTMYADPASHFFCETCINVQSNMHKKYDIYCPEERKNVSFDELYEARDVITVLRDQYVECPNQRNCALKLPLEQLENHYIECMQLRSIKCNKCGTEVPASSWNKHKAECKLTYDTEFPSQESDSRHNRPEHPPASPTKPPGSASRKTGAAKRTTGAAESLYPAGQLRHMRNGDHGQGPARTGTASLPPYLSDKPKNCSSSESEKFACQYCGRNVKQENMQRHLEKCYNLPIDCPFCHQPISRKDANAHVQNCQQDIEERRKESKKNEAAKTIRDQPQPRSYPDAQAAYQGASRNSLHASGGSYDSENVSCCDALTEQCMELGRVFYEACCCCFAVPQREDYH